ncbi:hypothetical protein GOP47_0025277 [Adiantum capillus-veneris]|uniref:Solute carrier family 40 member n=1 Tax=Adiantum capillus-veneris TaxID=13818 RepID=A0A9D4Z273_ADICA|nr:hypothetical protein GOP47_0025277 [Adiantum capillus-veneris]
MEEDGDCQPLTAATSAPSIEYQEAGQSSRARSLAYLYLSHFLTRWGSRMWEFGVGLFMISVWPNSLVLTSIYGLVEDLAIVSMGVTVGNWVDKNPRLKVLWISLGTRNGSVLASAIALSILLSYHNLILRQNIIFIGLIVLTNFFGGISAISGLATNIAVERDWVLAIADGQRLATLTELNSAMRGIDLTCKLLAPVLVGIIMSYLSVRAAAVLLCVWNVLSIYFEYYLLKCLYNASPELQQERLVVSNSDDLEKHALSIDEENLEPVTGTLVGTCGHQEKTVDETNDRLQGDRTNPTSSFWRPGEKMRHWASNLHQCALHLPFVEGLRVYAAQEMLLAAVALAILHFTVLSFGSLMTATLSWRGVPSSILGLVRGLSALVGICATLAYPKIQGRIQTIRTGLRSIVMQWSFLSLCVVSNWLSSITASSALLMGGVAVSRFGLWMFDLAVLQLMQESTPEHERGIVGGVQNSVQSFLEMLSFVAGMLISKPKDFDKLISLKIRYARQTWGAAAHAGGIKRS